MRSVCSRLTHIRKPDQTVYIVYFIRGLGLCFDLLNARFFCAIIYHQHGMYPAPVPSEAVTEDKYNKQNMTGTQRLYFACHCGQAVLADSLVIRQKNDTVKCRHAPQ